METSQFDQSLRAIYDATELPYEPPQWEALAGRLDAHEKKAATAIPMAAIASAKRTFPLLRTFMAAAAGSLFAMLVWKFVLDEKKPAPIAATTFATPVNDEAPKPVETVKGSNPFTPGSPTVPRHTAARTTTLVPSSTSFFANTAAPVTPVVSIPQDTSVAPAVVAVVPTPSPAAPLRNRQNDFAYRPLPDDEAFEREKGTGNKTVFGVNGGYNVGREKNNFTVGVTVARPLGNRLSLETGIAYVRGGYSGYREIPVDPAASSGVGTVNLSSSAYEEVSGNLGYLQAAPTLNYRVYRGFSAGGGVDAQRLLSNSVQTDLLNENKQKAALQPDWDFGVMARMDLAMTKKLRAGVLYRKSMKSTSRFGDITDKRDYLLLQLSLQVF